MGWSDDAVVLGKLPVPGVLLIWIKVGQRPTVLAVGAGGGCLDIFFLSSIGFLLFSLSPGETARYRQILSRRAVQPKTTNQPTVSKRGRKKKMSKQPLSHLLKTQ